MEVNIQAITEAVLKAINGEAAADEGDIPVGVSNRHIHLTKEDMETLLYQILLEFPISRIEFYMQGFVELLPSTHPLKVELTTKLREKMNEYHCMRDIIDKPIELTGDYIKKCKTD